MVVQATVNAKGLVDDVEVLRADHEGFGIPQAVMDAVMKYRFKPGSKNGVSVKTYFSIVCALRFHQSIEISEVKEIEAGHQPGLSI